MFSVRDACQDDLEAIREIFNFYVRTSTCTFRIDEETAEQRQAWFAEHGASHQVLVAEAEGTVVGWAALSAWKSACAYEGAAEVSVYVRDDFHRRGIGKALLAELIHHGRTAGLHTIIGGACTEHPASIALQKRLGFNEVGWFKEVGYKFGRRLDVMYLQLWLQT